MHTRNRNPAHTRSSALAPAAVCLAAITLAGCAFFDEPVSDLGTITPGAPPPSSSTLPPVPSSSTLPPPPSSSTLPPAPSVPQPAGVPNTDRPPALPDSSGATRTDASAPLPNLPGQGAYLTVASLIDIPEDATNLAFVHFTQSDSDRALAMCQAMQSVPVVPVENIPAGAATVLVWPVANTGVGSSCLEMISSYEALDISNATAERVNDSARGPFLLTRNSQQNKRLVYDLSFIDRGKFKSAVDEWRSLLGSDPQNWPAYRSAR
jgi:hypothetical protein